MAIEFVCPACGGTLQVGDETAGRVIRCGGCLTALRVPEGDAARTAPNPYEVDRPSPPPSLPTPPARSADPEPPAAVPVEPRRPRDPDDPYDDRPRRRRDPHDDRPRRRPPPPAPGYGVFFWLVVIGAVMLLGVVGCCGALFLAVPGAKWQKHESEKGGFQVELPGKSQPNAGAASGIHLEKGTQSEGAVLLRRPKQFFVFYRDVASTKARAERVPAETDAQLIEKEVQSLLAATEGKKPLRSDSVTVGGFDGREIEFFGKSGLYTARVVVADTRVYVLLAGGGLTQAGDPDVLRFLKSFEITNAKLATEGKRRAEQAKLAADAAKEAKEREAQRKAERAAEDLRDAAEEVADAALTVVLSEARARREAEDLRGAAETVADAVIRAALRAIPPPRRLPVAPPPRAVEN